MKMRNKNLNLTEVKKVKKALLVFDMQNVCVGENHATYFKYDNETAIGTMFNKNKEKYFKKLREADAKFI